MDLNKRPSDTWSPNPSKLPQSQRAKKDEHVAWIHVDRNMRETKARRARVQLKTLVDGEAVDVTKDEPVQTFGQYKYGGTWYEITAGTRWDWVRGCEVRNVPSRSLPAVLHGGGWMTPTERKSVADGAAAEDQNAPMLGLSRNVEDEGQGRAVGEEVEGDNAVPGAATPRRKRAASSRKRKENPQAEFSPRRRQSRKATSEKMEEEGSDIELQEPPRKQPLPSRRRQQPLEFPHGLEGKATAPPPVESLGQYLWKGTWYAILEKDPVEWVNGRPVRNVPAKHRAEFARRNGLFDDGI